MNEKILNFIDGKWVEPASREYLDCISPSTGKVHGHVASSDSRDVETAVAVAEKAFPKWRALPGEERASILRKIADHILTQLDELALAEALDNGKPFHVARTVDIPRSATNFSFFADSISQFQSESNHTHLPPGGNAVALNFTLREPLGVVACISPWNLPLYLLTWKIAPALATGNCVVAKPSEITPLTAHLLSKIFNEAGLPPGVCNFVHGLGPKVGDALSKHPHIKALSFTGSTATGAKIAQAAAPTFKKLSLEMGGKNAALVFSDCNFDRTVSEVVRSAFSNQGQICLCGSRIFIERPIYERFKTALVAATKKLTVGNPLDKSKTPDLGALVSKAHYEKILNHVEIAKKEGGKILCGGNPIKLTGEQTGGYYFEPTLIEGLSHTCSTNQEEIFGPVATVIPFDQESEAVSMVNSTRYGLAQSVWTENLSRAHRVSQSLH